MARVTVVNDTPEFLDLVGDILAGDRYETTLIDGDEPGALEQIRASRPDALIVDLRMGSDELHGWRIAHEIRQHPELAHLPILVCSADAVALASVEHELRAAPRMEGLAKPFDIDDLIAAIERLLPPGA